MSVGMSKVYAGAVSTGADVATGCVFGPLDPISPTMKKITIAQNHHFL